MATSHENRRETAPSALPALAPGPLLPARYSARARLVTWLKRVDHVRVREAVKRSDGKRYVLEVYMKLSQSRIPTAPRNRSSRATCCPDVTTERRFSEFSKLLSAFYYLAHDGHGFVPCTFCVGFVDYVLAGKEAPSRVHKMFHSEVAVCELLTQFINNLLELTRRAKTYEEPCGCLGRQQAPRLMKRFLSGDDHDDDDDDNDNPILYQ